MAPGRRGSKSGRNEGRKLAATALNNTGVAFVLAAFLQPALAYLQQRRGVDFEVALASAIFLLVGAACVVAAQLVVRRLED